MKSTKHQRRVAEFLQSPEFERIVRQANQRPAGACPGCGVDDARVYDVRCQELAICTRCGVVLGVEDGELRAIRDERVLDADAVRAVAAARTKLEIPPLPTCPFCHMVSRAGALVFGTPAPCKPSLCAKCGGMLSRSGVELLPFIGPLTEADIALQDEIRALAEARRHVEQQLRLQRRRRKWHRG